MASLKDNRKVKFNWTKEPTFKPQDRAVPCYQLRTIRPSCCQSPPKLTGRRPTLGQVSTGRHGPRHGPRGINYNMKTAVETIFVGKDRLYNRPLPADVQPLPHRLFPQGEKESCGTARRSSFSPYGG
jgi:hypothetical protein